MADLIAEPGPEVDSPVRWAEHGVTDEVRAARPYVRWTMDDLEPVREAYAGLSPGQRKTLLRWARQSDGLVIYRHSFEQVSVGELRYVYPEVRPDHAVQTDVVWHYHGAPQSEPLLHPRSGKPLPARRIQSPESMTSHIARDRDPDDHRGVNSGEVHSHPQMAKYLFPPSATMPVPWFHAHLDEYHAQVLGHFTAWMDDEGAWHQAEVTEDEHARLEASFADWLERHVRKHHPEVNFATHLKDIRVFAPDGQHEHTVRIKRGGQQLAKRLDVHPLVWKHGGLAETELVFFGIEGCIKADAILSALVRAEQPPAVFSVPSVSLWEATFPLIVDEDGGASESWDDDDIQADEALPFAGYEGDELVAFARSHLAGKLVCIVADADAYTKDEVMTQALLCRSTIRGLNARAEIVLPPDDRLSEGIKGVDDYLGKGGGTLEGMVWYRKEPPSEEHLVEWLRAHTGEETWRSDRLRRAARTLQALATHAGDDGGYSASVRLLARATSPRGRPRSRRHTDETRDPDAARKRFERGIEDLLELGAISANQPLTVRRERWRTRGRWQWSEDGVIITLHEGLRPHSERRSFRELMT